MYIYLCVLFPPVWVPPAVNSAVWSRGRRRPDRKATWQRSATTGFPEAQCSPHADEFPRMQKDAV